LLLGVGEVRPIGLDHNGAPFRRTLADTWEFVRFAAEQNRDRPLTSPPHRPEARPRAGCPVGRFRHRGKETIDDSPGPWLQTVGDAVGCLREKWAVSDPREYNPKLS
jgi:hypothetical protein